MKRTRRNHGAAFKAQVAFAARTVDSAGSAPLRRSLRYDQGSECASTAFSRKLTKMRVYFAHPHCPQERGTNENTNDLLRQFFPKDTRFTRLSRTEIKQVQVMFNDRTRNVLNWHSPAHAFYQLLRQDLECTPTPFLLRTLREQSRLAKGYEVYGIALLSRVFNTSRRSIVTPAPILWAMTSVLFYDSHPYLHQGMQVEVVRGPLQGVHGILLRKENPHRLVIGARLIQQATAVEIEVNDVVAS